MTIDSHTDSLTRLGLWLSTRNCSLRAFARQSGIPHPMLSRWARGIRRPGLRYALLLEQLTFGEVPASYWADLQVKKSARDSASGKPS
jgi:transcriptional regulator with XRE-family HTH domain